MRSEGLGRRGAAWPADFQPPLATSHLGGTVRGAPGSSIGTAPGLWPLLFLMLSGGLVCVLFFNLMKWSSSLLTWPAPDRCSLGLAWRQEGTGRVGASSEAEGQGTVPGHAGSSSLGAAVRRRWYGRPEARRAPRHGDRKQSEAESGRPSGRRCPGRRRCDVRAGSGSGVELRRGRQHRAALRTRVRGDSPGRVAGQSPAGAPKGAADGGGTWQRVAPGRARGPASPPRLHGTRRPFCRGEAFSTHLPRRVCPCLPSFPDSCSYRGNVINHGSLHLISEK